jgi:ion channel
MAEHRGWEEHPLRPWRGYGLVLVLLVTSFIWAAASDTRFDRGGRVVLGAATLLLALRAAGVKRQVIAIVSIPVGAAVVGTLIVAGGGIEDVAATAIINGLLVAAIPVAVFYDLNRTRAVTPHIITGLLCVYLVIGLFFTLLYRAVDHFQPGSFFAQTHTATNDTYLYFSFVTLTTVGYGDLTPAHDLGRTIAIIEALTGQLYLVTVVALAVSHFVATARTRSSAGRP